MAKKQGTQPLDEFIRKFKNASDGLAAIQKPVDDVGKVFQLCRVLASRYKPYNLAALSKPPYPYFSRYVTGLQEFEQKEDDEEKTKLPNYAHAFIAQKGRDGRGRSYRGRPFDSRGKGFI